MPYDPNPVSQGGNRGIDEELTRRAPDGKYRVIGLDISDGGGWVEGDFDSLEDAVKCADNAVEGKEMLRRMYVYDDGSVHQYGVGD